MQVCIDGHCVMSNFLRDLALDLDLTPLFNWNTKQLFLYVQAEYTNAQGVYNEVVIWDKIVRSKEDANLTLSGRNKYVFRNVGKSWKCVLHLDIFDDIIRSFLLFSAPALFTTVFRPFNKTKPTLSSRPNTTNALPFTCITNSRFTFVT